MLYADSKHLKLSNYDSCFWKIKMNINILEHRGSWVIEPAKSKTVGQVCHTDGKEGGMKNFLQVGASQACLGIVQYVQGWFRERRTLGVKTEKVSKYRSLDLNSFSQTSFSFPYNTLPRIEHILSLSFPLHPILSLHFLSMQLGWSKIPDPPV